MKWSEPLEDRTAGPLRTCLIVSAAFLTTGGQERANWALAWHLARRGHRVHLVAHQVDEELLCAGNVIWHAAPRPLDSTLLGEPWLNRIGSRIAQRLRREEVRVITNGGNCTIPADVNWVHYVHAAYERKPRSMMRRLRYRAAHRRFVEREQRALRAARWIVANSHRTARDLQNHVGVPREKIRVIYYGTDPVRFRPAGAPASPPPPAGRRVLFIGGLGDDRKGFDTLVRAWSNLCADPAFRATLLVLGRGAERRIWQRRIAQLHLGARIEFLGIRPDVPELLRSCDLLVAPTRYEPYGLGVHEALCCGVPAIVSAGAGVAERYPRCLRDLLLPDPNDASDLAQRIRAALAPSCAQRDALDRLSRALRARTWDLMAEDMEGLTEATQHWRASPAELMRAT